MIPSVRSISLIYWLVTSIVLSTISFTATAEVFLNTPAGIGEFCRSNTELNFNDSRGILKEVGFLSAWDSAMAPDRSTRAEALTKHELLSEYGLNSFHALRIFFSSRSNLIEKPSKFGPGFGIQEQARPLEEVENSPAFMATENRSKMSSKNLRIACLQLRMFREECALAIQAGFELAQPKTSNIAYISLYRDVILDRSYDEGLRVATEKLMKLAEGNLPTKSANLFDDLRSSFVISGITNERASEMTWKVLALIATGGAKISDRIFRYIKFGPETDQARVAITVISVLSPYLDFITRESGHIYSYPQNIVSTCETGKNYHFWLSAYLSRELLRRGFSKDAASAAAFNLAKGYQMLADTAGREPARPFFEKASSPYSNTIRMDLTYVGAGAIYGTSAGSPVEINIDKGLRAIISGGFDFGIRTKQDAEKLLSDPANMWIRWHLLFSPDSAFMLYRSQQK